MTSTESLKARRATSSSPPVSSLGGSKPSSLLDVNIATCVQLNPMHRVVEYLDITPPRPGNPADLRRVWTWATVLMVLTAIMFYRVAQNEDPTAHMREVKWGAAPGVAGTGEAQATPSNGLISDGGSDGDGASEPQSEGAAAATAAVMAEAAVATAAAADVDATLQAPAVQVTKLRSKGTLCIKHEHFMPEFRDVPPRPAEARHSAEWKNFAKVLASDAKTHKPRLVLLGDSITEGWRGTSYGVKRKEYKKGPELLAREFGEYEPLAMAISGDQTTHLLWRLQNGGFPTDPPPEYVAVMIGTNDLGGSVQNIQGGWSNGACVSDENLDEALNAVAGTVAGVKAVLDNIRQLAPDAKVVLLGLTPRGESHGKGWAQRYSYQQPSVYTAAIDEINLRMEQHVANLNRGGAGVAGSGGINVAFAPCKEPFLEPDGKKGGNVRIDR
eukprot:CAMPEP_0197601996 /NCGR_PEP_ID=MMETSP1326-20131121/36322_1 /TAXON_ID=1155430 /ORGANISM="Genus nov. species nov., Strain RCC2288" /LENGTH=441 /DNA_ID=CAMNT_0043169281 /DNA_START=65 /DNA_END=1387 /DNA_ORIENTATION=+